eukprot:CAMPEP_0201522408 /NCGR_PEP_ID=MMETSP0161_2-20130828/17291_1 /ASSEMBLY_ACC=CAM_ASM_000251 /TAXON_ID=180227 /ORGANISM="Neoparamoeba aestuarina, Strain SoJaBio B1-5/56/2" /LENGTH=93 /DNA_ID=CAMNT_0047921243 /DNA_START=785 /DNA_END=1062 /DNA_ORIENTATION=-
MTTGTRVGASCITIAVMSATNTAHGAANAFIRAKRTKVARINAIIIIITLVSTLRDGICCCWCKKAPQQQHSQQQDNTQRTHAHWNKKKAKVT